MAHGWTRAALVAGLLALLGGCSNSELPAGAGGDGSGGGPVTAQCDPAGASMPPSPPPGASRDGLVCSIYIPSPLNPDEQIALTVFEPRTLVGGQRYPLVLEGHGFSASRQTSDSSPSQSIPGLGVPIGPLRDAGYGIVSIDQAGHGETGGTIRVMDPDQEGQFLLAILDWLEANLDWYAIGPDLDAGEPNMVLGAIGPSYGGGFQYLIHAIDPKKRLDALVPQITWYDLSYSLFPGDVIKMLWDAILFGLGQQAGGGGNFDPFVTQTFQDALAANRPDQFAKDFFRYHGLGYFCDGVPVATNGGPGTVPRYQPLPPTAVHVLVFQGMRDTLFNFNEAWWAYRCLNDRGGDVRLFTYQGGHNSLQAVPDPGALASEPQGAADFSCNGVSATEATIAWFDEYLKGIPGAADAVLGGAEICLSLAPGDALVTDTVIAGTAGTEFAVPASVVVAGSQQQPTPVALYAAPAGGAIVAGVPRVELTLSDPLGLIADPDNVIVFVGTGRTRNGSPAFELADNQVQPLRGLGTHAVDLPGIGERLAEGEHAGILIYGLHEQFAATGGINAAQPVVGTVQVEGRAWLPIVAP